MRTLDISSALLGVLLFLPQTAMCQDSAGAPARSVESVPKPDAKGVYKVGNGVSAPNLLFTVEPDFSETARKKKLSGNCKIALVVDTNGNPKDLRVVHSVAEDQPEKLRSVALTLDGNAMDAVRQYRFEPALFQGKPVPVALTVEVNFMIF